jgi:hypothetical protein
MQRTHALAAILLTSACASTGSDDDGSDDPDSAGDSAPASTGVDESEGDDDSVSGATLETGGSDGDGDDDDDADSGGDESTGATVDPGNVWFVEPFEDLGAQNMYGFGNRYPQSETTWTTEHLPDGGFDGSGGAHVTIASCGDGCNTSENQFNIGWTTPELGTLGKPAAVLGEEVFFRWRIRFDEDHRWVGNSPQKASAKFLLFGSTGAEPNSRVILHLFNPYENGGCSLGFDYSFMDPPYVPDVEWVNPSDWGLDASSWEEPDLLGHVAAFTAHVNIGWDCAPGVLVTHAGGVDLPPQHVGTAPVDGWYHLQFGVRSGLDGTGQFRIWANNNDIDTPSSRRTNFDLQVEGWNAGVNFGGYWGVATGNTMGFVVDDLEVGDGFDAAWYPG